MSLDYFSIKRAGKGWGCAVICVHCQERPPKGMKYGYQRWRWLYAHEVLMHSGKNKRKIIDQVVPRTTNGKALSVRVK